MGSTRNGNTVLGNALLAYLNPKSISDIKWMETATQQYWVVTFADGTPPQIVWVKQ